MGSTLVNIDQISPNPNNPRKNFDEASLEELAASIREHGIIQPLVVKYAGIGESGSLQYRLICGERRLRAAKMIHLKWVPVVYRVSDTEELSEAAEALKMLVENLQREDLDPIEEAGAYQRVLGEFGYTQEDLAAKVGKSQAHIANRIRLLELPDTVRENISRGIISASAAKELLSCKKADPAIIEKVAKKAADEGMTVKQVADAVGREMWEQSRPLDKKSWPEPNFDLGECHKCKKRAMVNDLYQRSGDRPRCMNKKCWDAKQQETAKAADAEKERALLEKYPDLITLDDIPESSYSRIQGLAEYCKKKECPSLKAGRNRGALWVMEICTSPSLTKECELDRNRLAKLEKEREKIERREEIERLIEPRVIKGITRETLIFLAGAALALMEDYNSPFDSGPGGYLERIVGKLPDDWDGDLIEDWPPFLEVLKGLNDTELFRIILEWPAMAMGIEEGGMVEWFLQQVPQQFQEPEAKKKLRMDDEVFNLIGHVVRTHYNTGGVVMHVIGPDSDGVYSLTYKHPRDGNKCYINSITLKNGIVLCEGEPLIIDKLPARRYLDKNGRVIFVSTGLGGSEFGTFWETVGGKRRVKTPAMPMTPSREEAQRNLDAWAEKNGLQLVDGDGQCQPRTA